MNHHRILLLPSRRFMGQTAVLRWCALLILLVSMPVVAFQSPLRAPPTLIGLPACISRASCRSPAHASKHASLRVQPQAGASIRPASMSMSIVVLRGSNENVQDDDSSNTKENVKVLKRGLTKDFFTIGAPAFVQLAAEPLASLVDTAYLGRLGPEVLGGAGIAIAAQYSVSKLYNDPLLRTSISLVAAQDGKARGNSNNDQEQSEEGNIQVKKDLSIAVSSALLLAATVGLVQLLVYSLFCAGILKGMGLDATSPMWFSAVSYLKVRALGTPAATLWLVTNGIFRGLGDTKTPLVYSLLFTAMNAILDPFFIFTLNFGASGAAAGTAIAQYIALIPLIRSLHRKVNIDVLGQVKELGQSLRQYMSAGGLVLIRTLGKVAAYSVTARQAALMGPVAAAAYNLTFQLGFATTQICEAVAVAVQTLLSREMADTQSHSPAVKSQLIRHLIRTSVWIGGGVATLLSCTTYLQRDSILKGLTSNLDVRQAAVAIFPAVLVTQVLKGLAYPVNGIIMGGLDWNFSMITMWLANLACVGLVRYWSPNMLTLNRIWWALAAFMGTQVVTGIIRVQSKTGIWKILKHQPASALNAKSVDNPQ